MKQRQLRIRGQGNQSRIVQCGITEPRNQEPGTRNQEPGTRNQEQSHLGSYGYDYNGNQTSRPGHSLTYTPFNKVRTILDDAGNEVTRNVYDSDETRALRYDEQGTTAYVGPGVLIDQVSL